VLRSIQLNIMSNKAATPKWAVTIPTFILPTFGKTKRLALYQLQFKKVFF